ncbi:MAG: epoxyqueuosine reductase, partial [Candidatus Binatia bacterium]
EPTAQNCGTCTRCLPACPTGALRSPHELVSDRCIAFHTIENRGPIPRDLRAEIGDWVFGCDLCQDPCPVNEPMTSMPAIEELAARDEEDAFPDLVAILALDRDAFAARFNGRPVARANYAGLLRNACIALGNTGDAAAISALATALEHEEPLVRGHAAWALGRLGAREPLARRLSGEGDPWVREEITLALEDAA